MQRAGERFPRHHAGSMPAAVGSGCRAAPSVPIARASSCTAGCLQPVFGVCSQRRGCEGLPAQLLLRGGSCTYPALSHSVVGASSPGRAAGALSVLASLCLSLLTGSPCPAPAPQVPVLWHAGWAGPTGRLCQRWGRLLQCLPCPTESTSAASAGGGWMRLEWCSRCLCCPRLPRPAWILLCKSSLAGDWISTIVCARWSMADKMKLCLQTPIGTNSTLK